jgi:hypothetical protein
MSASVLPQRETQLVTPSLCSEPGVFFFFGIIYQQSFSGIKELTADTMCISNGSPTSIEGTASLVHTACCGMCERSQSTQPSGSAPDGRPNTILRSTLRCAPEATNNRGDENSTDWSLTFLRRSEGRFPVPGGAPRHSILQAIECVEPNPWLRQGASSAEVRPDGDCMEVTIGFV